VFWEIDFLSGDRAGETLAFALLRKALFTVGCRRLLTPRVLPVPSLDPDVFTPIDGVGARGRI
jgi:hypothetical protein